MKRTIVVAATLALIATGCSKSTTTSNPSESASTGGIIHMTAALTHVPLGSATVKWSAKTKSITVTGILSGLAPNSTHPMHIHAGSCAKQGGVVHPLPNLVANASGVAIIKGTVTGVASAMPAKGWYLNVHTGPTLANAAQFRPIACLDLAPAAAKSGAQTFSKAFAALPGLGDNASGTATVVYTTSTKTLAVTVTLHGLTPNSLHASHIHSGSCEAQGKVAYPLKNVKADAKGAATVTTTLTGAAAPSGPLYVNVHNSTDLSTQIGFTPVSCGNLTPSA